MNTILSNKFFYANCPDVYALYDLPGIYNEFNDLYFYGALPKRKVVWDGRLKRVWGDYSPKTKTIRIARSCVSKPAQVKSTLLHEMVHAYLDLIGKNDGIKGHGPAFIYNAVRINEACRAANVPYRVNYYDQEITQEKTTFDAPLLGGSVGSFDDLDIARKCESAMKAAFDTNYERIQ